MSIAATVQNNTIKLPPGLALPDGTAVRIEMDEPPAVAGPAERRTFAERYAKYEGLADDLPEDFALNHDHYLHGAPKSG